MYINKVALIIPIAVLYNMFFHKLPNIIFKDLPYSEKYNKTISLLLISGITAIVLNRLSIPENNEIRNGIGIGGLMLLFSALTNNWKNMQDMVKLSLIIILFIFITLHSYRTT